MPELPEVETIRRGLERGILNKTISRIHIHDGRVLRQDAEDFTRRLLKQTIVAVSRRGKALALSLSSGESLVVHVMMTGQLVVDGGTGVHTRVAFEFTDGTKLLYNDQRVFGQLRVVRDVGEINYFKVIGPEPFDKAFNAAYITSALKKTSRPIKTILLDHTFVAGIGNIYACEVLFRAAISPKRRGSLIKSAEASVLHREIVSVLKEAIRHGGSSMRNYRDSSGKKGNFKARIRVYAREGEPCLTCAAGVVRIVQSGRSTFYCMKCQR